MFHGLPAILAMMPLFAIAVMAMIWIGNRPKKEEASRKHWNLRLLESDSPNPEAVNNETQSLFHEENKKRAA